MEEIEKVEKLFTKSIKKIKTSKMVVKHISVKNHVSSHFWQYLNSVCKDLFIMYEIVIHTTFTAKIIIHTTSGDLS